MMHRPLTQPCEERTGRMPVICPGFELRRVMSDSYIIEVSSQAAGIVVRERLGYRFFAAVQPYFRLDGRLFRSTRDAERAAAQLANRDLTAA
jgi:hypothetical protein